MHLGSCSEKAHQFEYQWSSVHGDYFGVITGLVRKKNTTSNNNRCAGEGRSDGLVTDEYECPLLIFPGSTYSRAPRSLSETGPVAVGLTPRGGAQPPRARGAAERRMDAGWAGLHACLSRYVYTIVPHTNTSHTRDPTQRARALALPARTMGRVAHRAHTDTQSRSHGTRTACADRRATTRQLELDGERSGVTFAALNMSRTWW